MPDSAVATVAGVLAQLIRTTGSTLAMVVSRQGDDLLIEEAYPRRELAESRLRLPHALPIARPLQLDTARIRLPLDWTLACDGRPDHLVICPLGLADLFLVIAGQGPLPDPAAPEFAASRLTTILAGGQLTQRDLTMARHIRDLVDHLPFPVVFIDSRSFNALVNDPARDLLDLAAGSSGSASVHTALRSIISAAGVDPVAAFAPDLADRVFDLAYADRQYEVTIRSIERERLVGRLWVFRDVTSEREAARFKDELIANVSHELRTPLTSIVGALALLGKLMEAPDDTDVARLLAIAGSNAKRLGRLVDDLLDAGRLEAARLEIQPRTVDLAWLLDDTIELNRPFADRLNVRFAFARPDRPCLVTVDPDRMAQVLGNVLTNAAKFSSAGQTVQIVLDGSGPSACVRVIDQGRGMSPEFQQRLFTRFVRERDDGNRQPGTGLGLTIAKGIIEAMGGAIAIASAPGRGTTVTLAVPRATAETTPRPSALPEMGAHD